MDPTGDEQPQKKRKTASTEEHKNGLIIMNNKDDKPKGEEKPAKEDKLPKGEEKPAKDDKPLIKKNEEHKGDMLIQSIALGIVNLWTEELNKVLKGIKSDKVFLTVTQLDQQHVDLELLAKISKSLEVIHELRAISMFFNQNNVLVLFCCENLVKALVAGPKIAERIGETMEILFKKLTGPLHETLLESIAKDMAAALNSKKKI